MQSEPIKSEDRFGQHPAVYSSSPAVLPSPSPVDPYSIPRSHGLLGTDKRFTPPSARSSGSKSVISNYSSATSDSGYHSSWVSSYDGSNQLSTRWSMTKRDSRASSTDPNRSFQLSQEPPRSQPAALPSADQTRAKPSDVTRFKESPFPQSRKDSWIDNVEYAIDAQGDYILDAFGNRVPFQDQVAKIKNLEEDSHRFDEWRLTLKGKRHLLRIADAAVSKEEQHDSDLAEPNIEEERCDEQSAEIATGSSNLRGLESFLFATLRHDSPTYTDGEQVENATHFSDINTKVATSETTGCKTPLSDGSESCLKRDEPIASTECEEMEELCSDSEASLEAHRLGDEGILPEQSPTTIMDKIFPMALDRIKSFLVRELVNYAVAEEASEGSDGTQKRTRQSSSCTSSQIFERPPEKRLRGGGRDPGDEGDDSGEENDGDRPPKKNGKPAPKGLPNRRLKCPFYQRQPEKYSRASCRGEGFADMAKLKDHLRRVHTQPLRCSRCWQEMGSDDAYVTHLQANTICERQTEPLDDRIGHQLWKKLDFKKAPYAHAKNTEEKWRKMYSVLFPTDTATPSPYDQHCFSSQLEHALCEALEEELTKELAPMLEPMLHRIKQRIPTIIQNCKLKLLQASPEPDAAFTPSSLALSSTDSERDGKQHRSKRNNPKPLSGNSRARSHNFSLIQTGKNVQHDGFSPLGSASDSTQESNHTSSPESIFDPRATPRSPLRNAFEGNIDAIAVCNTTSPAHLGDFEKVFAVPEIFSKSQTSTAPALDDTNLPPPATGSQHLSKDFFPPFFESYGVADPSNAQISEQPFQMNSANTAHFSRPFDTPTDGFDANNGQGYLPTSSDPHYFPNDFDFNLEQYLGDT